MLVLPALVASALASPISAPAVIATPDSGPATPDPAAIHYNPAAIGATEGVDIMIDVQLSKIDVTYAASRNDGIDPNTSEPYELAEAHVLVPVGLIGATWKPLKWAAFGFAATDSYVGGGDYSGTEVEGEHYKGSQRYAGIKTQIITLSLLPAVAITPIKGVHIGGTVGYMYDKISLLKASDPLGGEGYDFIGGASYANDVILSAEAEGGHLTWSAGVFVDRWKYFQVGVSFSDAGMFTTSGEAEVTAPDFLAAGEGDLTVPASFTFDMPLPQVLRVAAASQINDKLRVGAGVEYRMWYDCCGGKDGDAIITLVSEDGDALGPEDGLSIEVDDTIYSPRRLWNNLDITANGGYWITPEIWVGAKGGYKQYAVPDFAVSATNLDFEVVGMTLAARYRFAKKYTVGLAYTKNFLTPRTITNSGWDVRDEEDPDYIDERFSTEAPYGASGNGTYTGESNVFGLRLSADL